MITIDSFASVPPALRAAYLAIGNFDGVHRGHSHLIARLRARANAAGAPALALTFDPHPAVVLRPDKAPVPLVWTERKVALLKAAGASEVVVFRTGKWLLSLTAREFFDRVIVGQLAAKGMEEGPTFGFGRDRGGDAQILGSWCKEAGIDFETDSPTEIEGQIVSSSRIRAALAAGHLDEAARLLGRPHRIRGTVIRGAARGAALGFPTANLGGVDVQIPADGVYAAHTFLPAHDRPYPAAVHIGPNATFGEHARSVEVHLIDFAADLYGQALEVDLLHLLRPSRKFESLEALVAQMHQDVAEARRLAGRQGR